MWFNLHAGQHFETNEAALNNQQNDISYVLISWKSIDNCWISVISKWVNSHHAYLGLHSVNTKWYYTGTSTGETVPVVSVSLTVKRYLWSPRPDRLFYDIKVANNMVPFLNSMTTINSRIGEQNQRLRRTFTTLTEANDRHNARRTCVGCYIVSCFPPNAIPDSVSITLSAEISTQWVIAAYDWQ